MTTTDRSQKRANWWFLKNEFSLACKIFRLV